MNEYAVLDSIYFLSHNNKYGGWCIASRKTIADELDLSVRTVFDAIEKGIVKGLIVKNEIGYLQTTDTWNEIMANKHDWYIAFNGKESQFVSGKMTSAKIADPMQKSPTPRQYSPTPSAKSADNNTNEQYNNQYISKEIQATPDEDSEKKSKKEYGNSDDSPLSESPPTPPSSAPPPRPDLRDPDINNMLLALKAKIGISAFVDSAIERNMAKHCIGLMGKIGKDEFVRRLDSLLSDSFCAKNCNKIKYVYNNIKGFIEPNVSSKTLVV